MERGEENINCVNSDFNAIKGMELDSDKFLSVTMKFEHCWQSRRASEECATDEEASRFWATPGLKIFVNDFHQYTDVRNQTDPLQWTSNSQKISMDTTH